MKTPAPSLIDPESSSKTGVGITVNFEGHEYPLAAEMTEKFRGRFNSCVKTVDSHGLQSLRDESDENRAQ